MRINPNHIGVILLVLSSCVDAIRFDEIPAAESLFVVEGNITTDPGPHYVEISTAVSLEVDSLSNKPVSNAVVTLYSSSGHSEELTEEMPGRYATSQSTQGQIGESYYITVRTADGQEFESEPDELRPVGEVDRIYFEYVTDTRTETFGEVPANYFNIFIDADAGQEDNNFVRWRFTGYYEVLTYPELNETEIPPYRPWKTPIPCSGYIVVSGPNGGKLEQIDECTCCECWVREYETVPQIADQQLVDNGRYNRVKVGEVQVNAATFHNQYMVEVEQMSMSKTAFEFYELIRLQKEGASDLFQPPAGKLRGNIIAKNPADNIVGLFWATAINKERLFIQRSDVPFNLTPIAQVAEDCRLFYPNSSTAIPEGWE